MEPVHAILLVLIGIGAGFVQRVSGFGLGIFVMMFLPHFMPSHTAAAAISSLFSCVTSSYNALRYRKNIANGIITGQILLNAAIGMVGCMVGDTLGKLVFDKLDAKKLKLTIYAGMLISGLIMFL